MGGGGEDPFSLCERAGPSTGVSPPQGYPRLQLRVCSLLPCVLCTEPSYQGLPCLSLKNCGLRILVLKHPLTWEGFPKVCEGPKDFWIFFF